MLTISWEGNLAWKSKACHYYLLCRGERMKTLRHCTAKQNIYKTRNEGGLRKCELGWTTVLLNHADTLSQTNYISDSRTFIFVSNASTNSSVTTRERGQYVLPAISNGTFTPHNHGAHWSSRDRNLVLRCSTNKTARALALKTKVLRSHHHHALGGGRWRVKGGMAYPWRGGGWLLSLLGWWPAGGGGAGSRGSG